MPRRLSPQVINLLKSADHQIISDQFATLKIYMPGNGWLNRSNPYIMHNMNSRNRRGSLFQDPDLLEYVATSSVIHNADAWSYIGRAIGALLVGDIFIAQHLGYYAELRAAMSILATQGIFIADNVHYIVDNNGFFHEMPLQHGQAGTHPITWLALHEWAKMPKAATLLGQVVKVSTHSLSDWIAATGKSSSYTILGSDLLDQWGLDLQRMANCVDQYARNTASYMPSSIRPYTIDHVIYAKFVHSFWSMCEAQSTTSFDALDEEILYCVLDELRKSSSCPIATYIGNVCGQLQVMNTTKNRLCNLKRSEMITTRAGRTRQNTHREFVTDLMSRALLLLRVSSGLISSCVRDAGIVRSDITFWIDYYIEQYQISPSYNSNDHLTDLWSDVEVARDDLYNSYQGLGNNKYVPPASVRAQFPTLQSTERVMLWSLGV